MKKTIKNDNFKKYLKTYYSGSKTLTDTLKLFYLDITTELLPQDLEKYSNFVSFEKQEQIKKIRFIDDKKRALFGELLVRFLYEKLCGIKSTDLRLGKNEFGKPFVQNDGAEIPEFNVSHSGKFILCGISKKTCGVDIEQIKEYKKNVAMRCFSEEEKNLLEKLACDDGEQAKLFYKLWTLKESYVKYIGKGFYMPLSNVIVGNDVFSYSQCLENDYMISCVSDLSVKNVCVEKVELKTVLKHFS